MATKSFSLAVSILISLLACIHIKADVVTAVSNGFQLKHKYQTSLSKVDAFKVFVEDYNKWWDASHSYSGKAENLSIDLPQRCILEKLPNGGFVRHMEVVYYEPGKGIRFTGGLGPLQQMGVCGALTVSFSEQDGKTVVEMEYNVSGRLEQGLDQFAPAVDKVLTGQFDSYAKLCQGAGEK